MTPIKKQWHVYLLECADGSLYCGITTDLERRLSEHNSKSGKGAKYTRARQPVKLVYSEIHPDLSCASKREAQIKSLSRNQKLAIIHTAPEQALNI